MSKISLCSYLYLEKVAAAEQVGEQRGRRATVLEILTDKFQDLPASIRARVEALTIEQLSTLGKISSNFHSIDDLNNWLDQA